MALLEVENLEVNYGMIKALKGISFNVFTTSNLISSFSCLNFINNNGIILNKKITIEIIVTAITSK